MKHILFTFLVLFLTASFVTAQANEDEHALTELLHEFMDGATVNDPDIHNRFWAEDLIYTSSSGERIRKQDILEGLPSEPVQPSATDPVYSAEDIEIQLYGDTAIVAFRLVAEIDNRNQAEVMNFYNTGTFLKRDGKWQVVAWQATRIPDE